MKLVLKVNNNISIWSDAKQYVIKVCHGKTPEYWYFGTLDTCFEEIFDHLCKIRLEENEKKEMKEVAKIILDTKKEIFDTMKPFRELKV